jgi:hypothetical protein
VQMQFRLYGHLEAYTDEKHHVHEFVKYDIEIRFEPPTEIIYA